VAAPLLDRGAEIDGRDDAGAAQHEADVGII
jgi:hypothetical protein